MTRTSYGLPVVYNSTDLTLTSGDGAAAAANVKGQTLVELATLIAGEDLANDVIKTERRYTYYNISTDTTVTIVSGVGLLHGIIINKGFAAGTVTIYDNTAASSTKIGTITFGASLLTDPPFGAYYDCPFTIGLTIVTSNTSDITVLYR